MSKKLILYLLIVSVCAFALYAQLLGKAPPPGVDTKGVSDGSIVAQYMTLATAIVSLLTAIVGLMTANAKRKERD